MARLRWGLTAVALALGFGFSAASAETPALFAGTGPAEGSYADALPVTIAVSSYVPPACAAKPCPLLIAVHGMGRNAKGARDAWKAAADRAGFLVLAPRFDKEQFPSRRFQQGDVRSESDKTKWTFGLIERLFDAARASGRVAGDSYTIFGHSAGAQFVHRMIMLMPEARIATAAVANAGYYTLPALAGERAYPYSLKGTPVTDATLARRSPSRCWLCWVIRTSIPITTSSTSHAAPRSRVRRASPAASTSWLRPATKRAVSALRFAGARLSCRAWRISRAAW